MTNEERIARGIDRAMDGRYSELTPWEKSFLSSLRDVYSKQKKLSLNQKAAASKVFKRLGLSLEDV